MRKLILILGFALFHFSILRASQSRNVIFEDDFTFVSVQNLNKELTLKTQVLFSLLQSFRNASHLSKKVSIVICPVDNDSIQKVYCGYGNTIAKRKGVENCLEVIISTHTYEIKNILNLICNSLLDVSSIIKEQTSINFNIDSNDLFDSIQSVSEKKILEYCSKKNLLIEAICNKKTETNYTFEHNCKELGVDYVNDSFRIYRKEPEQANSERGLYILSIKDIRLLVSENGAGSFLFSNDSTFFYFGIDKIEGPITVNKLLSCRDKYFITHTNDFDLNDHTSCQVIYLESKFYPHHGFAYIPYWGVVIRNYSEREEQNLREVINMGSNTSKINNDGKEGRGKYLRWLLVFSATINLGLFFIIIKKSMK